MSIPSFLKGSPPTHPNLLQKHPKKGHQNRARDTLIPSIIPFFSLNQSNNAFVFRVYRGITVYYPVMWGSLLNNQYFMESVSGTLFFFFVAKLGLNASRVRVQVTDFGLSKIMRPKLLDPNLFLGPGIGSAIGPSKWFRVPLCDLGRITNSPKIRLTKKGIR